MRTMLRGSFAVLALTAFCYASNAKDYYADTLMHEFSGVSWLLPGYSEPLDRWAKDGKYTFSFNVMAGNLACMQPDLPEWASFALVDTSQRADRCMVTIVWHSEEADELDDELPKEGENVFFTKWNPTLLTFDGDSLELFGGEGRRRQEKLSCAFQPVSKDGQWVKYDLEVVPKSDCGVRLNFGTATMSHRGDDEKETSNNVTAPDHAEL